MLNDIIKEMQAKARDYLYESGNNNLQLASVDIIITQTAQVAYEAGRKDISSIKIFLPTEYEHSVKAPDAYKEGFRKAIEMFKDRIDTLTPNDTI